MTLELTGAEDLAALAGRELDPSGWLDVGQDRIDLFAKATDDHQWIHVDPVRASGGPFGTTIAHRYLTLALIAPLLPDLVRFEGGMTLNYGLNKVRFPAAVPSGKRIRLRGTVASVRTLPEGHEFTLDLVVEVEESKKPACVAQAVYRQMV